MSKYIGMSKRMRKALENEGLTLSADKSDGGIHYECTFYTGCDFEKIVCIDLRNKKPKTHRHADQLVCVELRDAYDNYSVAEEMRMYLNAKNNGLKGVPEPDRLLADLQEEERRLERFADVANAVYWGQPIPPAPEDAADTYTIPDSYYAIEDSVTSRRYWKTLGGYHNGGVDTAWCELATADHFDTPEEARKVIDEMREESGDPNPGKVIRVEVETRYSIYDVTEGKR